MCHCVSNPSKTPSAALLNHLAPGTRWRHRHPVAAPPPLLASFCCLTVFILSTFCSVRILTLSSLALAEDWSLLSWEACWYTSRAWGQGMRDEDSPVELHVGVT